MRKLHTALADDVLAAFERACNEEELQVAEHLLRVLESISDRTADKERLERAYLQVVHSFMNTGRH